MAESALAARVKIHPPCMLKHRVQQEYNSLLVNALNRIFKSNLPLNNFKWLLTKLEYSCVRNILPGNGYPRSKSVASKTRPRWAAHTRIGNLWECPPGRLYILWFNFILVLKFNISLCFLCMVMLIMSLKQRKIKIKVQPRVDSFATYTRTAVALARWNFFLFLGFKTLKQ